MTKASWRSALDRGPPPAGSGVFEKSRLRLYSARGAFGDERITIGAPINYSGRSVQAAWSRISAYSTRAACRKAEWRPQFGVRRAVGTATDGSPALRAANPDRSGRRTGPRQWHGKEAIQTPRCSSLGPTSVRRFRPRKDRVVRLRYTIRS